MKKSMILVCVLLICGIFTGMASGIADDVVYTYDFQVTFSSNPVVASPGINGYLEIILESVGNSNIRNIEITAESWDEDVVIPKGNWDVYVGDLDGGEYSKILYEFVVSNDAVPGLYQIVFNVEYNPGENVKQTAFVRVGDISSIDLVSVSPNMINIGSETTLMFNVSNNGGSSINNLIFSWDEENDYILSVGADNRISVGSIGSNSFKEIPVNVIASPSITPGVYPLTVTLEYYDRTGTLQTITSEVGIQVSGGTDFEVLVQSASSASTTFAVTNTGANVASSVIVIIPSQNSYSVNGVSSVNLGNLDAGDYTLATFSLTSRSNATGTISQFDKSTFDELQIPEELKGRFQNRTGTDPMMRMGNNNLIVEISYTDMYGIRRTVEKEVSISSLSAIGNGLPAGFEERMISMRGAKTGEESINLDSGAMYIISGVAGILVIALILRYSKRKKK